MSVRTTRVTYVGHATVDMEVDGTRVLTDPVLRTRIRHLCRAPLRALPDRLDAVLISHGHHDHLDVKSLRLLRPETRIVVPRGLGHLMRAHFTDVEEIAEGDELVIGSLVVRALHAEHSGKRHFGSSSSAVGYAILGSTRVYFAGDTDLFAGMDGLVDALDLALLPIWGWGPRLGSGHLDPARAAHALTLLRPRIAVPIHHATLRPFYRGSNAAFLRTPAASFAAEAARVAPDVDVRVLTPGGSIEL